MSLGLGLGLSRKEARNAFPSFFHRSPVCLFGALSNRAPVCRKCRK